MEKRVKRNFDVFHLILSLSLVCWCFDTQSEGTKMILFFSFLFHILLSICTNFFHISSLQFFSNYWYDRIHILFLKETVSISVCYNDKTIEYEASRLKTVAEQLHDFSVEQGLTTDNILLKYHRNDTTIELSTKLGDLIDSQLEMIKIFKG